MPGDTLSPLGNFRYLDFKMAAMPKPKICHISDSGPLTRIILAPRYTFLGSRIHIMTGGMHKNKAIMYFKMVYIDFKMAAMPRKISNAISLPCT